MMEDGGGWGAQQQDYGGQQDDGGGWQQDDGEQGQQDYGGPDQSFDDEDDALSKKKLRRHGLGALDDGGPDKGADGGISVDEGLPDKGAAGGISVDEGLPDKGAAGGISVDEGLPDKGADGGISIEEGLPDKGAAGGISIEEGLPDKGAAGGISIEEGLPDKGAAGGLRILDDQGPPEHGQAGLDISSEAQRKFDALEKQVQSDKFMNDAQKYNDKQGYSVDFVRRLESLFGLSDSKESEFGKFSKDLVLVLAIYQQAEGLEQDGWLGDETLKSLRESYSWMLKDQLKGPGKEGREIIRHDAPQSERYDYYERLVKERFGVFREAAGEINIIGIRGMQYGKQVSNVVGQFNDTIAIVWCDEDGSRHVREFTASVDPGNVSKPMNPDGIAHIKDGSYVYKLGFHTHRGRRTDPKPLRDYVKNHPPLLEDEDKPVTFLSKRTYTALKQASAVTLYRDTDRIGHTQHGYIEAEELEKEFRGLKGIDMHFSGRHHPWSQGCQVIPDPSEYVEFIRLIKQGTNTKAIPYTVVDASKQ